jgi:ribosomal protein S1
VENLNQYPRITMMADSEPWQHAKALYPVGENIRGTVEVRFPFGVVLELSGVAPHIMGFIDIVSYNPIGNDQSVASLPNAGEIIEGVVAELVDRDQQVRIRVGHPFWAE